MTHLSPAEFVDLLDGRLGASRAAHAESCRACAAQADDLREAWTMAATEPHEPSPLFWDHFSARVSEAIRQEPSPSHSSPWRAWFGRPAFSASLALAVIALVTLAAVWSRPGEMPPAGDIALVEPMAEPGSDGETDQDDAWALVRSAAEDIEWDEAQEAGLSPAPGSAARAVDQLTADEQAELASLLEEEIRRSGA